VQDSGAPWCSCCQAAQAAGSCEETLSCRQCGEHGWSFENRSNPCKGSQGWGSLWSIHLAVSAISQKLFPGPCSSRESRAVRHHEGDGSHLSELPTCAPFRLLSRTNSATCFGEQARTAHEALREDFFSREQAVGQPREPAQTGIIES